VEWRQKWQEPSSSATSAKVTDHKRGQESQPGDTPLRQFASTESRRLANGKGRREGEPRQLESLARRFSHYKKTNFF
jgi:hypothetical protein